jgi:hypothetical protein
MTSNGDGSLYFLSDTTNHPLNKIDPTTGNVVASFDTAQAVEMGTQALAFWGGTFYVFVDSAIYAYDPGKNATTTLSDAPIRVTGAGQSTCVPKVPPPPK